jgi:hypothetical protein
VKLCELLNGSVLLWFASPWGSAYCPGSSLLAPLQILFKGLSSYLLQRSIGVKSHSF